MNICDKKMIFRVLDFHITVNDFDLQPHRPRNRDRVPDLLVHVLEALAVRLVVGYHHDLGRRSDSILHALRQLHGPGAHRAPQGVAQAVRRVGRQHEDALAALEVALGIAEETGERASRAELHRLKGEILLQQRAAGEAERCFRRALEVAREQKAKSNELRAATSLARLWQRQGKQAQARDLLLPLYDWFTEGFDTPDLKDAKALLDELARAHS